MQKTLEQITERVLDAEYNLYLISKKMSVRMTIATMILALPAYLYGGYWYWLVCPMTMLTWVTVISVVEYEAQLQRERTRTKPIGSPAPALT